MTTDRARELRANQTDAERKLWYALRNRRLEGLKFRRQHPRGPYILDFFCEAADLVVEVDGGQHTPEGDARRTAALDKDGLLVIRFWNNEVLQNLESCVMHILEVAQERIATRYLPKPT
jgi:very-short-patch-repair endonuclease